MFDIYFRFVDLSAPDKLQTDISGIRNPVFSMKMSAPFKPLENSIKAALPKVFSCPGRQLRRVTFPAELDQIHPSKVASGIVLPIKAKVRMCLTG